MQYNIGIYEKFLLNYKNEVSYFTFTSPFGINDSLRAETIRPKSN